MLLRMWRFLKGWVTAEVTGFSLERFINMAAYHGIFLWDVVRTESGIRISVSAKGFKLLKDAMRKTKSKIKIMEKHGLPFAMFRYRHRKILIGGVIFFVMALYALSSFVWRIDVQGTERVDAESVLAFLKEQGLFVGAYKGSFNKNSVNDELRRRFPDVGWSDIYIRGTRAQISLIETIPKQQVLDRQTPCHIVAVKDGLISAIVTGAGKPLVKRQDVVREGEVLVSGIIPLATDGGGQVPETEEVHAYAEVWARRYTPIKFGVPLTYGEKEYTGRRKTSRELQLLFLGGRALSVWNSSVDFNAYDKMTRRYQPGVSGDYPLPFIWITHTYEEFVTQERTRTLDEAAALAERMLNGRIMREFDFSMDIIDKQVVYHETPDALWVDALITTNERIDQAVPIDAVGLPEILSNPAFMPMPVTGDDYPVE